MNIPDGDHPLWRILYVLALGLVLLVLLSGVLGNYAHLTAGDIVTLLGMVIAAGGGQWLLSSVSKKAVEKKIEKALETETPKTKEAMDSTVATILTEPINPN